MRDLRAAEPALGNKALTHRLKLLHPGSAFGCKEVRAALHQLEADEQRTTADATASAQSTLEVNPTLHDDRLLRLEGMPTLQISQNTLQSDATLQEVKQSGGVLSGLGTAAPRLSSEGIDPRLSLEGIDPRLSLEGMDDPKAHQEQLVGNAAMGHERPEAAHATVGNMTTDEKLDQVLAQLAAMQARLADMDRENAQLRKDVEGSLANVSESMAKSITA